MRLGFEFRSRFRPRHVLAPALIATTLALAACGGSSSNSTGTAVPSSSTSAATTATSTDAAGMATSTASGAATAAATAAPTKAPPTPTSAPTAAPTKTATTASSGDSGGVPISAVPVMQDVADAWKNVTSYKMTMTIYDATTNNKTGTATVETMKDKSHWMLDEQGQSIEVITIGTDYYLKLGDTWTKVSSNASATLPPFSSEDILKDVSTPAASPDLVANKGTDTVNGVSCDVYEVKTDTGTTTLWVGHDDHLIYKGSFVGDGTRTEILFSDFNKDFNIQAPI